MGGVVAAGPIVPARQVTAVHRAARRPMRPSDHARATYRAAQRAARDAERRAQCPGPSERPGCLPGGRRVGVPVDWHRSTMAHLRSLYPFHADRGFGDAGVYLGTNVTAGLDGFFFDPFEFYDAKLVENPNV